MLTHDNLASNALTLVECWRFTAADVLLHALPIFHTHGLFVAINVALLVGRDDDLPAALRRRTRCSRRCRGATALMGVPTFYTRLLDHPGLDARGRREHARSSSPARRRCSPRPTRAGASGPATPSSSATA